MQCLFTLSSFHLVFWVPAILLNLVREFDLNTIKQYSLEPIKNKKTDKQNQTIYFIKTKSKYNSSTEI